MPSAALAKNVWYPPVVAEVRRELHGIPEHGQATTGPEHQCRFGCAGHRIEPMPGLPGDHRIEGSVGRFPPLEPRHFDLEPSSTGVLGHSLVGVDPKDRAPGRLEGLRGDAGADAHVEDLSSGARRDDLVDQCLRVSGSCPVVTLGICPEALGQLPEAMRLGTRAGGR
jgi:hypothetical protein